MKTLKNLTEDTSLVFAFLNASYPMPSHKDIVNKVKELSESINIPAKIYVLSHEKTSSQEWFGKMFAGISFEETVLESTQDILDSIEPYYNNIVIVDSNTKRPLFENKKFFGVNVNKTQPSSLFREFSNDYSEYLSESDTRKLFTLLNPPKKYSDLFESKDIKREKYFTGESFHLGAIVEDANNSQYEILDRANNYVVVVDSSGNISKKFIKDIHESTSEFSFRESFFKGFCPSDAFFAREDIVESFKKTISDYENNLVEDVYAIIKSLKSVDSLLNEHEENIGNIQYSLTKINQLDNHSYLEEMVDKSTETQLQAAQIIAGAVGSSTKGTPSEIVDNAIRLCVKTKNGTQTQILKKMLVTAEKVGLKYNKKLFESVDPLMGEIHRDHKVLKSKTTDEVLKDHRDLRKIGVDYSAKDVGGKREMIKDIISHKHGPNYVKSYRNLKADVRRSMDEQRTAIDELSTDTLKSYHRKALHDTITNKKNRSKGMDSAIEKISGIDKPLIKSESYGSDRAGEHAWQNNYKNTSDAATKLAPSKGHKIVDKKTGKTVSTHKTLGDAISSRKSKKWNSETHSIESIHEVHKDPEYKEEIEILG